MLQNDMKIVLLPFKIAHFHNYAQCDTVVGHFISKW